MRAWVLDAVGSGLEQREIAEPTPGPDEVVVDLRAAGLCHTDVGLMDGTLAGALGTLPIILGHEAAGIVSALGEGVTGLSVGDRVAISTMGDMDGKRSIGVGRDGAFAEKTVSPANEIIPIADSVPFDQAAAATDAGMSCYHAIFARGGLTPGTRVGIIGLGGLGLTGARLAVLGGGDVYAAEPNASIHAAALERGVTAVVSDILELADVGLELIIDFAGFGVTTAGAIEVAANGARIVQVGLGRPEATIDTRLVTMKQLDLLGSLGGTPEDVVEVLKHIEAGELEIATKAVAFAEIADAIERLQQGKADGKRLVAVF